MLKTQAIKNFLLSQPYPLGKLYNENMEVQVNVSTDEGEPVKGDTSEGFRWQGFTDGIQTWKHFRIPWRANTEPTYEDSSINFDLSKHANAIGMTGWDYKNKKSRWVGFDFDSLIGHKQGLHQDELTEIKRRLSDCNFVTIFNSTSGTGLHIYVFIDSDITVNTHTEHAAVARSVLAKISALTGLQLESKVDTLGGNMWVWHKKAKGDSYKLLKQGDILSEIPINWKEYLNVVTHKKKDVTNIDDIVASQLRLELDEDHIKLLRWFESSNALWWVDDSKQMLVCHTYELKRAHRDLNFKGVFDTLAVGKDQGHDQNCFCFPVPSGQWIVRRHNRGTKEFYAWFTDTGGWTTTYFNGCPSFKTAARTTGGTEGEHGYYFKTVAHAVAGIKLCEINISIPEEYQQRKASITETKDGRLKLSFEAYDHDDPPEGFVKSKKILGICIFIPQVKDENPLPDNLIRHVVAEASEYGWFINTSIGNAEANWVMENKGNVVSVLISRGYKRQIIEATLGAAVSAHWKLVNKPFQPVYPGNREWNKDGAQFRYKAEKGKHPTWDMVFRHCGECLNDTLCESRWGRIQGIITGMVYLQGWCAACFQAPTEPLPYLFFTGPQGCGKSIFHEALSILFTKGYTRADQALTNPGGFNGELAGAIVCVVEETNLSKRGYAADRIKDWVTGRTLSVHSKNKTPYMIQNTTHWIQCANSVEYCPVLPGDTRITLLNLSNLRCEEIPKAQLLEQCEQEAPAFLYTLLNFELPFQEGRLSLPVIETEHKRQQMAYNEDLLSDFIKEKIFIAPGYKVEFGKFYFEFSHWLPPEERQYWSNKRVGKVIPFVKGRSGGAGETFIGNISFEPPKENLPPYKLEGGRLKN